MLAQASSCVGAFVVYLIIRTIYRLHFHPLSKIPGPKLAAATNGYEFYFNVIKRGKFIWEIERLHEIYGPIIRITPKEIHIKDSNYYEEIYASSSRKREKDGPYFQQFDMEGSGFVTVAAELHRERRAPLNKLFSKSATTDMLPILYDNLDKLCRHIKGAYESDRVIKLDAGFAGLTSDTIYGYFLGYRSGNLDSQDFNEHVRDGINALTRLCHVNFFFPIIQTIVGLFPLPVLKTLNPHIHALMEQKAHIRTQVVNALSGKQTKDGSALENVLNDGLSENLRGVDRLANEGMAIVSAGIETTGRALAVGFYQIISNKDIQTKLREELKSVIPTPQSRPAWDQLRQLPYLSSVILETLRLATGIAMRSPRVAPTETLIYGDHVIPPGTSMSQHNYFVLMDPEIFSEPHVFDPERWLRAATKGEHLERYLVTFSKGSRNCLGMNLAYAELYLTIATLVRQFDFTLHDTTWKDIAFARDFSVPYPEEGNTSLQVLVRNMIQE
ncbi:hypothetical protein N7456_011418 [Penicillium angulare]|uniref:Cytochrome P450 n=1 Tax=Penicillium angulare TaxID=116970 RepID=A0A9W9ETL9_9EURO|nr:hypothetical protein N7456_011418 [Penicillium angulare]